MWEVKGLWSREMTHFGKVAIQFAEVPVEASFRLNWLKSKVVVPKHQSSSEFGGRAALTMNIVRSHPEESDSVYLDRELTHASGDLGAGGLRSHLRGNWPEG